VDDASLRH